MSGGRQVRLEVYVCADCRGSEEARAIAAEVQDMVGLSVEVVEVDGTHSPPPNVFATPAYVLDGRLRWLGNPRREALRRELSRRLRSPA